MLRVWSRPWKSTRKNKAVQNQESTKVSNLKVDGNLSWSQLDKALPMPVNLADEITKLAVDSSDFIESLNQQTLKVTGLTDEKYTLKIDGNETGKFTREELATGINLAVLNTPMAQQAKEVHKLTIQHNNLHFERWREIQMRLAKHTSTKFSKATEAVLDAYDTEEAELVETQRNAAKPVKHQYELVVN